MTSLVVFLKEVRSELGKVSWLNRQQTLRLTLIVISISIAVGIFIGSLDFLFTKLMEVFL